MTKSGEYLSSFGDKCLVIPTVNSKYMPCLPNVTLSNDKNVLGITLWIRKTLTCMIVSVQNNLKISSLKKVVNFLFFGAPSFSNNPKLGLKVNLKY